METENLAPSVAATEKKHDGIKITLNGEHLYLSVNVPVLQIKQEAGVNPTFDLVLVEDGMLTPLPDDGSVKLHCNQEFIAHAKCGASS